MPGIVKGISDAFKRSVEPFITESIAPEAIFDILMREGETREGRKLYTEGTPFPDQVRIATKHILKTQIPFSQSQLSRIYYATKGLPDKKGNTFDIENELPGIFGWRLIEINPLKGLSFKITNYATQKRNATREFTGGDTRLLSGAIKDPKEIARQFFIANQSLFNAQSEFHLDLKAANEFEVTNKQLAEVFGERNVPDSTFGPLLTGKFRAYTPSENIIGKFYKIDEDNNSNAMEQAFPIMKKMIDAFQNAPLGQPFNFKLKDFGIQEDAEQQEGGAFDPFSQAPLDTPGVNPANFNTASMNQGAIGTTGLTSTEQALLSPEEQAIRLRQRGQA